MNTRPCAWEAHALIIQPNHQGQFLIFTSKIRVKSETLAMKTLYQLQKIGYFWILVFGLKLDISGTLIYNFFLVLICRKKSKSGVKSETHFLRKKLVNSLVFEGFMRCKITLRIGNIRYKTINPYL